MQAIFDEGILLLTELYADTGGIKMGYKIHYASELDKKYPMKTKRHALPVLPMVLAVILLLCGLTGNLNLKELILPGNADVTGAALTMMIEQIKAGEPLNESITAFCTEIITHGK